MPTESIMKDLITKCILDNEKKYKALEDIGKFSSESI